MRDWISITAKKEHTIAIAKMTETHYGEKDDIAQAEYLEYEYFNNPDGDAIAQIAWNEQKQKVYGQEVLIPRQIKIDNRLIKVLMSGHTITEENHRGQGIFSTLGRDALKVAKQDRVYEMTYGMPNQNSYHGFVTKLGYKDIGSFPLYLLPIRPSQLVKEYLHQNLLSYLAKPIDKFFNYGNIQLDGLSLVKLTNNNLYLVDEFWKEIKDKYPIMIYRNRDYMKYRFLDIPRRKYELWYALRDDKIVAFASGRVMEVYGMQCGMVADFIFVNGYEKDAKNLLKHLLYILKEKGASLAGCLMQSFTGEAKILKNLGFFVCPKCFEPQPFPFIVQELGDNSDLKKIMNLKNWFFTMGDYDVV